MSLSTGPARGRIRGRGGVWGGKVVSFFKMGRRFLREVGGVV